MFDGMTEQDGAAPAAAVAVIGMAGRFPGADNPSALWDNLRAGVESITFFTDEQLLASGEVPERLRDGAYVKACARLSDIAGFDAGFFGMYTCGAPGWALVTSTNCPLSVAITSK